MKSYKYNIEGLDCAHCGIQIQDSLNKNSEYEEVVVNFANSTISFKTSIPDNVMQSTEFLIRKIEPEVVLKDTTTNTKAFNKEVNSKKKTMLIQLLCIVISICLFAVSTVVKNDVVSLLLVVCAYVLIMTKTIKKAFVLLKSKIVEESFLVILACFGALLLGERLEGFLVILLYDIGKILEQYAINNSRNSIKSIINIKPEYANKVTKSENETQVIEKISPQDVEVGDILEIKTGEKIPVDSIVISGNGSINTMALTGESNFVEVKETDKILSGSVLESGFLTVKAIKKYEDSAIANVMNLIENASSKKAQTQNFVEKLSRIYTPVIILMALVIAGVLPFAFQDVANYSSYIYKALIFLVVSCPCAIVISVPLAYFISLGKMSKLGILVKGSVYIDNLKDVNQIFLDKTGTLTNGQFMVVDSYWDKSKIKGLEVNQRELENLIYKAEEKTNHPIAKAIVHFLKPQIKKNNLEITNFKEIPGVGISFNYNDYFIKIGKNNSTQNDVVTFINIEVNDEKVGHFKLKDEIKSTSFNAIKGFKKRGLKTIMLTGDTAKVSKDIAQKLEIEKVYSNLYPKDKYENVLYAIENNKKGKKVIFVGDGINDSPVLKLADVGISMGNIGQKVAIESSDVVILNDDLNKINTAIDLAKFTNKIIVQNLIFALGVKFVILALTLCGYTNMYLAIFADVGVTLLTIFNSSRILKVK